MSERCKDEPESQAILGKSSANALCRAWLHRRAHPLPSARVLPSLRPFFDPAARVAGSPLLPVLQRHIAPTVPSLPPPPSDLHRALPPGSSPLRYIVR